MKKTPCFIFDIDGTLADHKGNRSPYDENKVSTDTIIEPVACVLRALIANHYPVIFVSGRTEGCRQDTRDWIKKEVLQNHDQYIYLYMRKIDDHRNDSIVKKEIYDTYIIPFYEIIGVFDDRMRVCRMLYENNIFCFNVNQGLKEF